MTNDSLIELISEIDLTLDYFQTEFPALANEKNRQVWADPISYHCGGISPDDLMKIRIILDATREPVSVVDSARAKTSKENSALNEDGTAKPLNSARGTDQPVEVTIVKNIDTWNVNRYCHQCNSLNEFTFKFPKRELIWQKYPGAPS